MGLAIRVAHQVAKSTMDRKKKEAKAKKNKKGRGLNFKGHK